jgi:hypothetical protein
MMHCELVPGRGIRHDNTEIFFGMRRDAVREALGQPTETIWGDEDEYATGGDDWLRLRYLDGKLCDIEVLGGSLTHKGIELKNTEFRALRDALHNSGFVLEDETEWLSEGRDCIDLQIVVATADDLINEPETGDGIAWVITSSDFRVESAD